MSHNNQPPDKDNRDHMREREIVEIHPVILGGDPVDPSNKASLDRQQHLEYVRYWNRIIKDLRLKR